MKRSIIGLLLAIPSLAAAQSDFQKGYVVNNAMDTLKGYVDYRTTVLSATSIKFKPELSAETQTFTPTTARGYGISGKRTFETHNVNISLAPTRTEALKVGVDTSSRRTNVFLELLQTGSNVSMYSYTDGIKERFYLKGKVGATPYELMRTRFIEAANSNKIITRDRYKGQLLFEMRNYNGATDFFEGDFNDLAYTEPAMIKVASIINRQSLPVTRKSFRYFAGAGLSATAIKYSGQHVLARDAAESTPSYMPSLSFGIDLFPKAATGRIVIRTELSLFLAKDQKITNGIFVHSFDQVTLHLSPKFLYNVYNTENLKVYAGLGIAGQYASYSNNKAGKMVQVEMMPETLEETPVDLIPMAFSYNFNFGVVIKRIEIAAMFTPAYNISDYAGFNIKTGIIQAGIKYRFDR